MNSKTSTILLGGLVIILVLVIVFLLARGAGLATQTATSTSPTTTSAAVTATTSVSTHASTTVITTTETKPTYHNATSAQITVSQPAPGATVSSNIVISGHAVGPWYSEAVFPVQLLDKNGTVIATGQAHAQGDWMTTSLVPFTAQITVPQGYTGPATLVLAKDNPSGLPANDASVTVPITIK